MSLYDHYRTDIEKDWLEWGDTGASFLIARASGHHNAKFKAALERKLRKYRKEIQLGILPDEVQTQAAYEVFAETVILDWKGVRGPSVRDTETGERRPGPEIPYSQEACVRLFQDLPELYEELRAIATDRATFQDRAELEDDAKN